MSSFLERPLVGGASPAAFRALAIEPKTLLYVSLLAHCRAWQACAMSKQLGGRPRALASAPQLRNQLWLMMDYGVMGSGHPQNRYNRIFS